MSVFKCKMCGGDLEITTGESVAECQYCGTKQTLPKLDDDRRTNLYNRANHFRRNNDYDKAMGIYEQILNEDSSDAEAYWSLVLCRYGIEYVEDPATHKRVPTVNRAQFTSIFDDDNYKSALQYADENQRSIYEDEASAINEIQKGILAISQNEEPFDVFICYKETDENGRRTQDSVLANDLYHQLTQEGFKVFFSRITLEDKLGTAYEPYIFAALNSAKVMVVLGTKPENFNAVWVKNEWSRYLGLVKQSGGKKVLIPAYRDMDPYDLPDEFSHLQAQDMSKLGFMQDLIRGIKKIVKADEPKQSPKETVVIGGNANVAPLLKRAFMFLEDGNWAEADAYCEKVLDQDPENAQAYLGKLMAELRVSHQEDLPNCEQPFDNSNNYQKAVRFGGEKTAGMLSGYIDHINERNENARLSDIYNNAVFAMKSADSEASFKTAAEAFKTIPGFKDADLLTKQCLDRAEVCRKDAVYASARNQMNGSFVNEYESAIKLFSTISGWKDADEQIYTCQRKIEEIKAEHERKAEERRMAAEKAAKKRKKIAAIVTPIVVACIAFVVLLTTVIIPKQKLNKALGLLDSGDYEAAYALLEILGNNDAIVSNKHDRAMALIDSGDYKTAYALLKEIGENDAITSNKYDRAMTLIDSGDYDAAYALLKEIGQYKEFLLSSAQVGSYVIFGEYEQDNNSANGAEDIEWLVLAKEGNRILVISKYALDCLPYNISDTSVTWETCSLREWLNGKFINAAFSEKELAMIPVVTVSADKNSKNNTDPGNSTTDQVFLLSTAEAAKYLASSSSRQYQVTAYCYNQSAYQASDEGRWWWTRTPGKDSHYAAVVTSAGTFFFEGRYVTRVSGAVRPALWIDLGS